MKHQANYSLFPKRKQLQRPFKKLPLIQFQTNFYQIDFNINNRKFYQYQIELPEHIPNDSIIQNKCVHKFIQECGNNIGYITHKGEYIWGDKNIEKTYVYKYPYKSTLRKEQKQSGQQNETNFQQKYMEEDNIEVYIKLVGQYRLQDMRDPQHLPSLLQILNISLKSTLSERNMQQYGKSGKYFSTNDQGQGRCQLQIKMGYKFTIVALSQQIRLQIDICSRVQQKHCLIQLLNKQKNIQQLNSQFVGETIITTYGRIRTYKIEQIDNQLNPLSTFESSKTNKPISYKQYYKQYYGIDIFDLKQPLIRVSRRQKVEINNQINQLKFQKKSIYLVPELVKIAGITKNQKKNSFIMKQLSNKTKFKPGYRQFKCRQIINILNKNNSDIRIGKNINLQGFTLSKPYKKFQSKKNTIRILICYAQSLNYKDDNQDIQEACHILKQAGRKSDIDLIFSKYPITSINTSQWKNKINKKLQYFKINKKNLPDLIAVFYGHNDQLFYGVLKKYFTEEINIVSQFIKKSTLQDDRKAFSAAEKICQQINVKVGKIPWKIQLSHQYFKNNSIMYGGLSLSQPSKDWILSFVGTVSRDLTQTHSQFRTNIKQKENLPISQISKILVKWGQEYIQKNNKKLPNVIILYREGLAIAQMKEQLSDTQIPALTQMCEKMRKKCCAKQYQPEIIIVTVNKHINNRIYERNTYKNFQLTNPDQGTVIIDQREENSSYDFYLIPQKVTQGTATPTLFKVAYGKAIIPVQALIQFTYGQCYGYFNWMQAIRVPACLQNANKLAKLVGQGNLQQGLQKDLQSRYYYL